MRRWLKRAQTFHIDALGMERVPSEHGLERVREPYVKYLEKGLWEIRMKGGDGISRALYVVEQPKRVVVVKVFVKKTQKTPRKEIKLALKKAEEIT
jgi:phage-related protein